LLRVGFALPPEFRVGHPGDRRSHEDLVVLFPNQDSPAICGKRPELF
jgi:hypothetical protein